MNQLLPQSNFSSRTQSSSEDVDNDSSQNEEIGSNHSKVIFASTTSIFESHLAHSASFDSACSLNEFTENDGTVDDENTNLFAERDLLLNEVQGIALLRQIFPEESTDSLRRMHRERLSRNKDQHESNNIRNLTSFSYATPPRDNRENEHMFYDKPFLASSPYSPWNLQSPYFEARTESHVPLHLSDPDGGMKRQVDLSSTSVRSKIGLTTVEPKLPNTDPTFSTPHQVLSNHFIHLPSDVTAHGPRTEENEELKADNSNFYEKEHFKIIQEASIRCLRQYQHHLSIYNLLSSPTSLSMPNLEQGLYTRVLFRDDTIGLGLTLFEQHGSLCVHSLTSLDGKIWSHSSVPQEGKLQSPDERGAIGPALQAGIAAGDVLIGLNGTALLETLTPGESLLRHAVATIRGSPDPIVLHLLKGRHLLHNRRQEKCSTPPPVVSFMINEMTPSLLDASDVIAESQSAELTFMEEESFHSTPILDLDGSSPLIHPFIATLRARGFLQSFEEERAATLSLARFTKRTRQWEANLSFRIATTATSSRQQSKYSYNHRFLIQSPTFSPSKLSISSSSSSSTADEHHDAFIPLMGVRQALCIRILNTFLDGDDIAYTIWVYDVDLGKEWYAPVRYFRDFCDLRSATIQLNYAVISQIPFPKQTRSLFFASPLFQQESSAERELRCRQLEHFLRSLCAMIYREKLHSSVAEIAIHIQSFLGCESSLRMRTLAGSATQHSFNENRSGEGAENKELQFRIQKILKRSIQKYIYRLFLLEGLGSVIKNFIDSLRSRVPRRDELEILESQGRSVLKARAMKNLEQMESFLNELQDSILEGCMIDFQSIAKREEYQALHGQIHGKTGKTYWDKLVCEAVREQVEIEVYVPLRSVVSRWLVNGWRHEDMEVHFKVKELRKRSQASFRIPEEVTSQTGWSTVANILKEGVGMSTLPCLKLRAIADSAREISRILISELQKKNTKQSTANKVKDDELVSSLHLGADDFLPIFIYCVVQADLERPCALCILLRTLCDSINRMGEIGYYLASFEAAITHIQEINLSEDQEEMSSFLSVPLNDSS